MTRFILVFLTIVYPSIWGQTSKGYSKIKQDFEKNIYKEQLDNGIRVILLKRTESPTLALYMKFLVGAVDESPEEAGLAHLLEHMLFKGTNHVGTSDYIKEEKYQTEIEELGEELDLLRLQARYYEEKGMEVPKSQRDKMVSKYKVLQALKELQEPLIIKNEDSFIYEQNGEVGFNAYTTQDVTNYQIQLPKNRLEVWAKLESDRLLNPVLREFYTEREVIGEERRMRTENSGQALLREKFFGSAFEAHPYRKPVIGYSTTIPYLGIKDAMNFFHKHYTPDNMVICIVGDMDFQDTMKIIKKYFSPLKSSSQPKYLKTIEPPSNGEKRVEVLFPGSGSLVMGFPKPSFPHADDTRLDLLNDILTRGTGSRLYKRLVVEEKLCLAVSGGVSYPGERYSNLFVLSTRNTSNADPAKIESIIWDEIEKIIENGVTEEELDRVKNHKLLEFFESLDSNSELADNLSYYELLFNDWKKLFVGYEKLETISTFEVQRMADQYLKKDRAIYGILKDSRKVGGEKK